jgi:anti-sigma factor RsiW
VEHDASETTRQPGSERGAEPLSCGEIVELLTDYLDNALEPAARERVEQHLALCPECATYIAQMRTTIGLLGRLREQDVPKPVLDELVRAFRGWQQP